MLVWLCCRWGWRGGGVPGIDWANASFKEATYVSSGAMGTSV